jgi:succinate dehydrogenase / fumarate reductase cytochrome b subunit
LFDLIVLNDTFVLCNYNLNTSCFMNNFLNSSLGRKVVMAATGLFLCVFLVEHLYGNLLLYAGDGGGAFNEYSHDAVHSILIRTIEVVLFIAIVLHVL